MRTWNMSTCVCTFQPSCACRLGSGEFLSTHGGPLSARWMVSASVREVTAGWPGLSWPWVWILSSDSSWQLPMGAASTAPPTHELASWKLLVYWEINDVSQHALMKCKWYEPHPGEMRPELISDLKEVAADDWIIRPFHFLQKKSLIAAPLQSEIWQQIMLQLEKL